MKKISEKRRDQDVKDSIKIRKKANKTTISFKHRKKKIVRRHIRNTNFRQNKRKSRYVRFESWHNLNKWIDLVIKRKSVSISKTRKGYVTIYLPKNMNFSSNYESTAICITAIRALTDFQGKTKKAYSLFSVNFDQLEKISTSAALVLTAEISRWDDRTNLVPKVTHWNNDILSHFNQLGFFNLFRHSPKLMNQMGENKIKYVEYLKGKCGDAEKTVVLKKALQKIIGQDIDNWMHLYGGLSEAITNVSHHAYPIGDDTVSRDKNWYLTGCYDKDSKTLKVAFYDQGIGIPESLPASEIKEKVLDFLKLLPLADRTLDSTLLKAAVEIDRTSTNQNDRGKGLQDLLTYIKERGQGYLSLLSLKGLYKCTINKNGEVTKSVGFNTPIPGTLIIWSVTL